MKKLSLVLTLIVILFSNTSRAQAIQKGNIVIDTYYGAGNLINLLEPRSNSEDIKYTNLGTAGVRFEYIVAEHLGIGFEFNAKSSRLTSRFPSYDSNNNPIYIVEEIYWNRVRFMPRLNFHFLKNEHIDLYGALGLGYAKHTFGFTSTSPYYEPELLQVPFNIGMRFAFGARYFFTENLGAHMEFGLLGGDLLHAGLSIKF